VTKYLLECPACETRFDLKAYAPERRVRCRKCGTVVVIPYAPDDPAAEKAGPRELPPELRRKVARVFSLRRLALLAGLLVTAALGGAVILVKRHEARLAAVPAPPELKVTAETLPSMLGAYALPLGRGFSWDYALSGGGSEVREVLHASVGAQGEPEFELGIRGSSQAGTLSLRVSKDGVLLVGANRAPFDAPLVYVPHPLFTDGSWTQEGPGWKVEYQGVRVEKVQCPAGIFDFCVRVEVRGTRLGGPVDETLWYARGVGLVKRETKVDGRVETAQLRKYTVRR
jgi:hypothetical protein